MIILCASKKKKKISQISSKPVFHIRYNRLKVSKRLNIRKWGNWRNESWNEIEKMYLWAYPNNRILGNSWKHGKKFKRKIFRLSHLPLSRKYFQRNYKFAIFRGTKIFSFLRYCYDRDLNDLKLFYFTI